MLWGIPLLPWILKPDCITAVKITGQWRLRVLAMGGAIHYSSVPLPQNLSLPLSQSKHRILLAIDLFFKRTLKTLSPALCVFQQEENVHQRMSCVCGGPIELPDMYDTCVFYLGRAHFFLRGKDSQDPTCQGFHSPELCSGCPLASTSHSGRRGSHVH